MEWHYSKKKKCNFTLLEKYFLYQTCGIDLPQNNGGEKAERQPRVLVTHKPELATETEVTETQPLTINYTRKHLKWFLFNIQKQKSSSEKVGLLKGMFFGQWYSTNQVNSDFNRPGAQMANYILCFSHSFRVYLVIDLLFKKFSSGYVNMVSKEI